MKLLTKAIENKMPKLYSTEGTPTDDKKIICKFFNLGGSWSWYAVEGERQEDGDYIFFGLVDGHEKEWGYFSLRELESVRWMGMQGIERDVHFSPVKVRDCIGLNMRIGRVSNGYVDPAKVMMMKEDK